MIKILWFSLTGIMFPRIRCHLLLSRKVARVLILSLCLRSKELSLTLSLSYLLSHAHAPTRTSPLFHARTLSNVRERRRRRGLTSADDVLTSQWQLDQNDKNWFSSQQLWSLTKGPLFEMPRMNEWLWPQRASRLSCTDYLQVLALSLLPSPLTFQTII